MPQFTHPCPHLYKGDSTVQGLLALGLAGREELRVGGSEDHHVEEALVREVMEEEEEDLLSTGQGRTLEEGGTAVVCVDLYGSVRKCMCLCLCMRACMRACVCVCAPSLRWTGLAVELSQCWPLCLSQTQDRRSTYKPSEEQDTHTRGEIGKSTLPTLINHCIA